MNYIKTLEDGIKAYDKSESIRADRFNEFRVHLQSSKFNADPTIQVSDVQRWISYIQEGGQEC